MAVALVQRLGGPGEVVVYGVKGHGGGVVFDLLGEGVGEPRPLTPPVSSSERVKRRMPIRMVRLARST